MNGCSVDVIIVAPKTEDGLKTLERAAEVVRDLKNMPEIAEWIAANPVSFNFGFGPRGRRPEIADFHSTLSRFVFDGRRLIFSYRLNCADGPLCDPFYLLSAQFPELVFRVHWMEGGYNCAGWFRLKAGNLISDAYADAGQEQGEFDLPPMPEEPDEDYARVAHENSTKSEAGSDESGSKELN